MSHRGQEGLKRNVTRLDVKPHFYFAPRKRDHVKPSFLLLWLIKKCVCTCNWYRECERKCGLNVLTWLACCAAPWSGDRVIQVLECEVPMELWKWELSGEMGIAPRWFVTCATSLRASSMYIHHSFNQNVYITRDRKRLCSVCVVCNGVRRVVCIYDSVSHSSPGPKPWNWIELT